MEWNDIFKISTAIIASLGGGGVIVLWLAKWIGSIFANKYVEKFKYGIQKDLEDHKTFLRKEEFLFQKEFEATSAFISLCILLLPRRTNPMMEWYEACQNFAYEYEKVEKSLESYIAKHGAALQDDMLKNLTETIGKASEGKANVSYGDVSEIGIKYAGEVMTTLEEIQNELCRSIRSNSGA